MESMISEIQLIVNRSEDLRARDIWSLGAMVQGSGQMGELLGRRRRRRRQYPK